jgi:hypothetical protein
VTKMRMPDESLNQFGISPGKKLRCERPSRAQHRRLDVFQTPLLSHDGKCRDGGRHSGGSRNPGAAHAFAGGNVWPLTVPADSARDLRPEYWTKASSRNKQGFSSPNS